MRGSKVFLFSGKIITFGFGGDDHANRIDSVVVVVAMPNKK